jgi:nanoRNase/pAp phosphatase (c-di-AMP/oligoRNAs hydrolase)
MNKDENLQKLEDIGKAIRSRRAAILTHNNPDPDAIAAAMGFSLLLKLHYKVDSAIFYGGIIGRAENRLMVRHLKIPLKNIHDFDHRVYRTVALIDTQPSAGNNALLPNIIPDIIIDHHIPVRKKTHLSPFHDIRPDFGSSSTIVFGYLKAAGIAIPSRVATALFYGIKTDTYDLGREFVHEDIEAYTSLVVNINRKLLGIIEHPLHRQSYFIQMHQALENVEIFEDLFATVIWDLDYPEATAEIADWFYTMRGIKCAIAIGIEKSGTINISMRTRDRKRDAGRLIRAIVGRRGMAGGHTLIAGGAIHAPGASKEELNSQVVQIKKRFFETLSKTEYIHPTPLILHYDDLDSGDM